MNNNMFNHQTKKFIETEEIKNIIDRSLLYLDSGFPVHFSGISGSGKTSLALELAKRINNDFVLIYGNEDFRSIDLLGNNMGFETKTTVDNFVHSVYKTKEETKRIWTDNRITTACKHGYTLIYDEFTRTPAESNNVLLSVLEEKILQLPPVREGNNHLKVDPNFKAIFTSNPCEYAGVHPSQDALLDRMITISLNQYNSNTIKEIIKKTTGVTLEITEKIISLINYMKQNYDTANISSLRTGIKLSKILKNKTSLFRKPDQLAKICLDIMSYDLNADKQMFQSLSNYIRSELNE